MKIKDNIITDLFNYALDQGIGVEFMCLSPDTPPAANVNSKLIAMNSNWHNKDEIPFQFAHEISHITLKQQFDGILYFTPFKYGLELDANRNAIKMLLPYYVADKEVDQLNSYDFMQCFGIPYHLEDIVIDEIRNC